MSYKLICIDMDGTLLNNEHKISAENKSALLQAYDKGIIIAITTGRLFSSAKSYYNLLGIEGPIISSNGTHIEGNDFIYKSTFSFNEVKKIYEITESNNLPCYFYTFDTAISKEPFPNDHPYVINNKTLPDEDRIKFCIQDNLLDAFKQYDNQILKAITIINDPTKKDVLLSTKNQLKDLCSFEVVSSGDNNFEVMKKGSSKGAAVKKLAEKLGINREEIICIGDNENDLSMIQYAGVGIAMGNACELLKQKADYITDTNENSGVAKAILKYI